MTTLVDTSVWVEFLRGTDSAGDRFLQERVGRSPVGWTGPVLGEILAGSSPPSAAQVERMVAAQEYVAVDPLEDFVWAADAYRRVRSSGRTVRSLMDCVIAAVCVRTSSVLVHRDSDFEVLAGVTDLRTTDLR